MGWLNRVAIDFYRCGVSSMQRSIVVVIAPTILAIDLQPAVDVAVMVFLEHLEDLGHVVGDDLGRHWRRRCSAIALREDVDNLTSRV